MNRFDWRQIAHDLLPLLPIMALCVVLALNIALHHDAYVPPVAPIYVVPVTTTTPETASTVAPTTTTVPVPRSSVWDALADCESGRWDRNGTPIPGSRNWASTSDGYHGGLHFTADTWNGNRPAAFPTNAEQATAAQQIAVAEIVLRRQGARAWPVCGPKAGLR